MLDVHAPDHRMHGVRDFFLHLFTITVGLLIALALEGGAENIHKRELRRDAEANLRREIQDNAKELAEWVPAMKEEQKNVVAALDFLQARKVGKTTDTSKVQMGFEIRNLSAASWKTAAATGALGLMDYKQVQHYAAAYDSQEEMTRLEHITLDDFLRVQSYVIYGFDPSKVSAEEAAVAEPDLRHALAHLVAMQQVAGGVQLGYEKALKGGD